jgi:hypothetical protein
MKYLHKIALVPPILFGLLLISRLFYACYSEIIFLVLLALSVALVKPIAAKFKPDSSFRRIIIALLFLITTPLIFLHIILGDLYFDSSTRNSGIDSTIVQYTNNLRAQAEVYYFNNNESYESVCSTAEFVAANTFVTNWMGKKSVGCFGPLLNQFNPSYLVDNPTTCNDSAEAYAVEAALPQTEKYYCVDSSGQAIRSEISIGSKLQCSE